MEWVEKEKVYKIAGSDVVVQFLASKEFNNFFKNLLTETLEPLTDSSNLTFGDWKRLSKIIENICLKEGFRDTYSDNQFSDKIFSIYANPLLKGEDYLKIYNTFREAEGFILVGYGAGNLNILKNKGYSPLAFMEKCVNDEKPVVLCSFVPMEIGDFEYECGLEPIKSGAIPALDRSVADAQIKLAYILGHKDVIVKFAIEKRLKYMDVIRACFLSGSKFLSRRSKDKYFNLYPDVPYKEKNSFIGTKFEDALEESYGK